jgi:hypothetical protein
MIFRLRPDGTREVVSGSAEMLPPQFQPAPRQRGLLESLTDILAGVTVVVGWATVLAVVLTLALKLVRWMEVPREIQGGVLAALALGFIVWSLPRAPGSRSW